MEKEITITSQNIEGIIRRIKRELKKTKTPIGYGMTGYWKTPYGFIEMINGKITATTSKKALGWFLKQIDKIGKNKTNP